MEIADGKINLLVFNDTKEAELHKHLNEHIQNHIAGTSKDKQGKNEISKKAPPLYYQNTSSVLKQSPFTINLPFYQQRQNPVFVYTPVLVPPPDKV
jgi:hypothetical protein